MSPTGGDCKLCIHVYIQSINGLNIAMVMLCPIIGTTSNFGEILTGGNLALYFFFLPGILLDEWACSSLVYF